MGEPWPVLSWRTLCPTQEFDRMGADSRTKVAAARRSKVVMLQTKGTFSACCQSDGCLQIGVWHQCVLTGPRLPLHARHVRVMRPVVSHEHGREEGSFAHIVAGDTAFCPPKTHSASRSIAATCCQHILTLNTPFPTNAPMRTQPLVGLLNTGNCKVLPRPHR